MAKSRIETAIQTGKFRFGELKACNVLGVLPLKCIIYGVLYIKETSFVYHDKRGFFFVF